MKARSGSETNSAAQGGSALPSSPPTLARRASPHIKVWLLPSEKAAIQAKAAAHTLSDSAYLRALGLDVPVRSTLDQEAVLELAKINGELSRLGGVLKSWLINQDHAVNEQGLTTLVEQLEHTRAVLLQKVEGLGGRAPRPS